MGVLRPGGAHGIGGLWKKKGRHTWLFFIDCGSRNERNSKGIGVYLLPIIISSTERCA